jgi:FkbM family methyltransferase|tara:strand:- start:1056 stop:1781 length:726 start_codon:yes stop_codon:yes gene_type:complete
MNNIKKNMVDIELNGIDTFFNIYETHDIICNQIKEGEPWEPWLFDVYNKYITKESVVIEAGCHIGTHTMVISDLCKTLYCFEPLPSSRKLLESNIALNKRFNVAVSPYALGEANYKSEIGWSGIENKGATGILKNNAYGIPTWAEKMPERIEVDVTYIDNLRIERLDFIKADVEGFEINLINGGLETIKKHKPVILIEWWADGTTPYMVPVVEKDFKMLLDIGYRVENVKDADYLFTFTDS